MEPTQALNGKRVHAHFLAVHNEKQEIIGDAIYLDPPIALDLQMVGNKMGVQIHVPKEDGIGIHISDPHIVGVALLDANKNFLVALSIPGNPEEGELFVLRSRYIILGPKPQRKQ